MVASLARGRSPILRGGPLGVGCSRPRYRGGGRWRGSYRQASGSCGEGLAVTGGGVRKCAPSITCAPCRKASFRRAQEERDTGAATSLTHRISEVLFVGDRPRSRLAVGSLLETVLHATRPLPPVLCRRYMGGWTARTSARGGGGLCGCE